MCGVENDLESCCFFFGVVFLVANCALLSKWLSPHSHLSMSFALYLRHGCGKRMYHFEGRIARRDGYDISRDVSRAANVTIIEDRVVRHDRCMERYVPHGSGLRDSRCVSLRKTCITIFDIASHDIAHLLLMNWNTCFADLVSVFL